MATDGADLSRCRMLYDVLYHYEIEGFDRHDTGVRLRGDIGQYYCDRGNPELGVNMIEKELRRNLFTVPSGS